MTLWRAAATESSRASMGCVQVSGSATAKLTYVGCIGLTNSVVEESWSNDDEGKHLVILQIQDVIIWQGKRRPLSLHGRHLVRWISCNSWQDEWSNPGESGEKRLVSSYAVLSADIKFRAFQFSFKHSVSIWLRKWPGPRRSWRGSCGCSWSMARQW